jgi:hypothetical protein
MRRLGRFVVRYRALLRDLHLTLGGRVAFTFVAALGVLTMIGDLFTNGDQGDQVAAVVFIFVVLALGIAVVLDAGFRVCRSFVRRLLGRAPELVPPRPD